MYVAHSFKGSAGAVGFKELSCFAHHLESFLIKIRNNKIAITSAVITLLLESNDQLVTMVSELKLDFNRKFDASSLIQRLSEESPEKQQQKLDKGYEIFDDEEVLGNRELPKLSPSHMTSNQEENSNKIENGAIKKNTRNAKDESLRVNLARIDSLVNDVGELVILQTVLSQNKHLFDSILVQKTISQLQKITRSIQDTSMGLRMIPIKQTFQKMQRIVRDTSQALGKQIIFEMVGESTEVDKTILDTLADPLVHMIRNAVDHGIEDKNRRIAIGKSEIGLVKLTAYHQSKHLIIEINDDGKGIDAQSLITKAKKAGILAENTVLTQEQALHLVFAPGFTTKEEVTSISGRGVGMDVVKTHIDTIQGRIEIESVLGQGTTFRVILPLTLAIVESIIVKIGEEQGVIPLAAVIETIQPKLTDIAHITGKGTFLSVRDETFKLFYLNELLGLPSKRKNITDGIAIIGQCSNGIKFALLVDDIKGQQQIVIKPLGEELNGMPGISGAAILGDGRASMIIEIADLINTKINKNLKPLKEVA